MSSGAEGEKLFAKLKVIVDNEQFVNFESESDYESESPDVESRSEEDPVEELYSMFKDGFNNNDDHSLEEKNDPNKHQQEVERSDGKDVDGITEIPEVSQNSEVRNEIPVAEAPTENSEVSQNSRYNFRSKTMTKAKQLIKRTRASTRASTKQAVANATAKGTTEKPKAKLIRRRSQALFRTKRKKKDDESSHRGVSSQSKKKKADTSSHRGVSTRPTKLIQIKDGSVVRKFELVARRVRELQFHVTWEEKEDQDNKPKLQPIFMVYDEMIDDPQTPVNDRFFRRGGGQLSIQVPDDFDEKKFGALLEQVGKEMKKGRSHGSNWKIVKDIKELHHRVFGSKKKFRANGNGTGKQQAAKNNWYLGRGYECPAPPEPSPVASLKEDHINDSDSESIEIAEL